MSKLLTDSEYTYLKQAMPHQLWHYGLLLLALGVGSTFVWYGYDIKNADTIMLMAVVILSIYWFFQFRVMQSAVHLAKRSWQDNIPDEQVGTLSKRSFVLARIRAVLRHYSVFIILMSLALLGLCLVLSGYFLFWSHPIDRGWLQYVGVVMTGFVRVEIGNPNRIFSWWSGALSQEFPRLEFAKWYLLMGAALFVTTLVNTVLSASIGLYIGHAKRAMLARLVLLVVVSAIFFASHNLRETFPFNCHRTFWDRDRCHNVLESILLIDSFQASTLSFLDGGITAATGLHPCGGNYRFWGSYRHRHLLAMSVTVFTQLVLSSFLLYRVSSSLNKKKIE